MSNLFDKKEPRKLQFPRPNSQNTQAPTAEAEQTTASGPLPSQASVQPRLADDPYGIGSGLLVRYIDDIMTKKMQEQRAVLVSFEADMRRNIARIDLTNKELTDIGNTLRKESAQWSSCLENFDKTRSTIDTSLEKHADAMRQIAWTTENSAQNTKRASQSMAACADDIEFNKILLKGILILMAFVLCLQGYSNFVTIKELKTSQQNVQNVLTGQEKYWYDENNHAVYLKAVAKQNGGGKQ